MGNQHAEHWLRIQAAYLQSDDPRGQSGFRGDEAAWSRARLPIIEALDRDGAFLDVGCANGLLMESIAEWAGERGIRLESFGLELSSGLVRLARERLPDRRDRIFEGDVRVWRPPRRFDFVRTELVYVSDEERRHYLQSLLDDVVLPDGRLVVCSYGSFRRDEPAARVAELLHGWGFPVAGEAEATNEDGFPITRVAWIDGPLRRSDEAGIP